MYMTQKMADEKFAQTGNFEDYIIDSFSAYKVELASNKKLTDRQYQIMNNAISGCQMIVKNCFKETEKIISEPTENK